MKVLGISLVIIGISMIAGYFGYLLKINSKEEKLTNAIIFVSELVSFSPFTIGFVLMGIGLLLILK